MELKTARSVPVLVGQAQILQREDDLSRARGPVDLMADAVCAAFDDASCGIPNDVDAIHVLRSLSTKSHNPALAIARSLGITSKVYGYTTHGGNLPQALVNSSALDIQAGRADLVVLTGGESSRSRRRAKASGETLDWMVEDPSNRDDPQPTNIGGDLEMLHPLEIERKVVLPIEIYPMFETALRAAHGMTVEQHRAHVGALWSRFSEVAASNPFAWTQTKFTSDEIVTPTAANRMVGYPYTKMMNSNNDVDMAAALVMCSVEKAISLGIPRDRWVFPIAGTDAHEHNYVSHRWSFVDTPAIRIGAQRLFDLTGWTPHELDVVDVYSCFPSAVQLGAASIELSLNQRLTCTGGLPFAGGPFNNYVMHAIATTMIELRRRADGKGFVWANGGYATKHSFGAYQVDDPRHPFLHDSPQDAVDALPARRAASAGDAAGDVTIEAYSVMHDRDGSPARLAAAVLTDDGVRSWGVSTDSGLLAHCIANDAVGERLVLSPTGDLVERRS